MTQRPFVSRTGGLLALLAGAALAQDGELAVTMEVLDDVGDVDAVFLSLETPRGGAEPAARDSGRASDGRAGLERDTERSFERSFERDTERDDAGRAVERDALVEDRDVEREREAEFGLELERARALERERELEAARDAEPTDEK